MYLRNAWYCFGWSTELQDRPIGRTLLEQPIVIYRSEAGKPIALGGRCPHRFAPLHMGQVISDRIECPYHGLVFDRSGQCVLNPHGGGDIPKEARVPTYPVEERDGTIWIWMGDRDSADPTQIPDTRFVADPGYAVVSGYVPVDAHYQLVIDNLLDLTHPAVLHKGGLSSEEYQGDKMHHRFLQEDRRIHSQYSFRDMNPSPQLAPMWGERKCDVRAFMTLNAPTNLYLDFRMTEVDGDVDVGLMLPTVHLVVPESQHRTHYFYAMGRNALIDDEGISAGIRAMAKRTFEDEDEPMIRACQEMMGTTDLFSLKPVILKTDVAAVRGRMLIDKLIAAEAKAEATKTEPRHEHA